MEIGRGWSFNRGLKSIFSDYKCVDSLSLFEEQAPGGPEADVPGQEVWGCGQLEAQQGASIYRCLTSCSSREKPGRGDVSSSHLLMSHLSE